MLCQGIVAEWFKAVVCKTIVDYILGSNPSDSNKKKNLINITISIEIKIKL